MNIRLIRTIDQDDTAYDDMWIVEEEENMEERLDKLKEIEEDIRYLDFEDFEKKYNGESVWQVINNYIYDNFNVISNYNYTDLYI